MTCRPVRTASLRGQDQMRREINTRYREPSRKFLLGSLRLLRRHSLLPLRLSPSPRQRHRHGRPHHYRLTHSSRSLLPAKCAVCRARAALTVEQSPMKCAKSIAEECSASELLFESGDGSSTRRSVCVSCRTLPGRFRRWRGSD
jgi:hypothetical protein